MMALRGRTRKRDFHPDARVIILIKEPVLNDVGIVIEPAEYLEVEEYLDIQVTCTVERINSATINLSNLEDRWFAKAKKVDQATQRQQEIVEYLKEALHLSELREANRERREDHFIRKAQNKLAEKEKTAYYDVDENGRYRKIGVSPQTRPEAYSEFEYLPLDFEKMRRVWIDFKNRNNEWVAGFTGYISNLQIVKNAGQAGTISIGCKGLLGLFQRSEIFIQEALDPKDMPFRRSEIASLGFEVITNNLSPFTGDEIIERVVALVNDYYSYSSRNFIGGKIKEDYFYQEKLWLTRGDAYPLSTSPRLSTNTGYGPESVAINPAREWNAEKIVYEMLGKLIIDPEVRRDDRNQFKVFNYAIQTALQLYQNKPMFGYAICQKVAEIVGYEFFEDPKGNLVFQIPKYDVLPRLRGDVHIHPDDIVHSPGLGASPILGLADDTTSRFTEYYSNIPYHSRDYIIDDIGLKNLRYIDTEDGLVTFVTTHALPDQRITPEKTIELDLLTGFTSPYRMEAIDQEIADYIVRLNRRYGVRRHDMQPLPVGTLDGHQKMLDRWALQSLISINSHVRSGTVSLNQRPDLWVGRTIFLVEEQKLAYVVGTVNTFNKSARQSHDTQLSLVHIHHPSEFIGIPWNLAITEEADYKVGEKNLFRDVRIED